MLMFDRLRDDILAVRSRDPAARSVLEVILCYPGIHALILHRLAKRLWRLQWCTLARFVSHVGRVLTGIEIHPGATIGQRVFIDHGMGVVIGETAVVGDDCTIYQGVTLGGTSLTRGFKRHPTLGRGVIIGAGAQVLGNFMVGDGAKVGSNAVVVKEVPPGATAVGNPARVLLKEDQQRREETAAKLGFSAYGLSPDDNDPLSLALHGLIDHAAAQDRRIAELTEALQRRGIEVESSAGRVDDPRRLDRLVD
jgi:serine O-acetyltransferase